MNSPDEAPVDEVIEIIEQRIADDECCLEQFLDADEIAGCKQDIAHNQLILTALRALKSAPVSQWVSVDERLPEEGIRVNAWDGVSVTDCFVGFQPMRCSDANPTFGTKQWRETYSQDPVKYKVTHWQPLPESPAEPSGVNHG